jgi:hypothetical protein
MNQRVVFFNHYNAGDVHVSREYVKWMLRQNWDETKQGLDVTYRFVYQHNNNKRIFKELPSELFLEECITPETVVDRFRINTWYGAAPSFDGLRSCTIKTLHRLFEVHASRMGFTLPELGEWALPDIPPLLDRDDKWLNEQKEKYDVIVMVVNCKPKSSQSAVATDKLELETCRMADHFKPEGKGRKILFILTNPLDKPEWDDPPENVLFAHDILGTKDNLYECGQLSQHCDVIIGQSSGPYTFALNKNNLLDEDKVFLCFVKPKPLAYWAGGLARCTTIWASEVDQGNVGTRFTQAINLALQKADARKEQERRKNPTGERKELINWLISHSLKEEINVDAIAEEMSVESGRAIPQIAKQWFTEMFSKSYYESMEHLSDDDLRKVVEYVVLRSSKLVSLC